MANCHFNQLQIECTWFHLACSLNQSSIGLTPMQTMNIMLNTINNLNFASKKRLESVYIPIRCAYVFSQLAIKFESRANICLSYFYFNVHTNQMRFLKILLYLVPLMKIGNIPRFPSFWGSPPPPASPKEIRRMSRSILGAAFSVSSMRFHWKIT